MIRVDEATSARPEARYSLGLFTATLLLMTYTAGIGLNVAFPRLPVWANWSLPAVLGVLLGFVFAARPALGDSLRALSPAETIAGWLVAGALFSCVGAVFKSPLAGLVALQVPAVFTLVTERGYARLYVLSGTTIAMALSYARTPPAMAIGILAGFLLLMTLTMAYETFFFALENAPAGAQLGVSSWLPLRVAVVRFLIAAAVTAPVLWLTPMPAPRVSSTSSGPAFQPKMGGSIDRSFTLIETFLYTMLLVLLLLVLGAFLKWIRNRHRRRGDEIAPESLGVPVGEFRPIEGPTPVPPPDPRTPIGKVVFWYHRFSESTARRGRGRKLHETPGEFREALATDQALPEDAIETITLRFEKARYAPEEVTEQEAHEFQLLVEETVTRMSSSETLDET